MRPTGTWYRPLLEIGYQQRSIFIQPRSRLNSAYVSANCSWNLRSHLSLRKPTLYRTIAIAPHQVWKSAFIALGSNVGNRLQLIEQACRSLSVRDDVRIKRTSGLWETKAMYVTDQGDFLNGVCEVRNPVLLSSSARGKAECLR